MRHERGLLFLFDRSKETDCTTARLTSRFLLVCQSQPAGSCRALLAERRVAKEINKYLAATKCIFDRSKTHFRSKNASRGELAGQQVAKISFNNSEATYCISNFF